MEKCGKPADKVTHLLITSPLSNWIVSGKEPDKFCGKSGNGADLIKAANCREARDKLLTNVEPVLTKL